MRLTFKGTVRGKVIITVKRMLRITFTDMARINGKCIVRCMMIITIIKVKSKPLLFIPALCISHVVAFHQ